MITTSLLQALACLAALATAVPMDAAQEARRALSSSVSEVQASPTTNAGAVGTGISTLAGSSSINGGSIPIVSGSSNTNVTGLEPTISSSVVTPTDVSDPDDDGLDDSTDTDSDDPIVSGSSNTNATGLEPTISSSIVTPTDVSDPDDDGLDDSTDTDSDDPYTGLGNSTTGSGGNSSSMTTTSSGSFSTGVAPTEVIPIVTSFTGVASKSLKPSGTRGSGYQHAHPVSGGPNLPSILSEIKESDPEAIVIVEVPWGPPGNGGRNHPGREIRERTDAIPTTLVTKFPSAGASKSHPGAGSHPSAGSHPGPGGFGGLANENHPGPMSMNSAEWISFAKAHSLPTGNPSVIPFGGRPGGPGMKSGGMSGSWASATQSAMVADPSALPEKATPIENEGSTAVATGSETASTGSSTTPSDTGVDDPTATESGEQSTSS